MAQAAKPRRGALRFLVPVARHFSIMSLVIVLVGWLQEDSMVSAVHLYTVTSKTR